MAPYRKLVVTVVGLFILVINRVAGLDLSPAENDIVDAVIAVATAVAVYRVPNAPLPPKQ